jgi:DNA repair protein RecN (Recombination protein N)
MGSITKALERISEYDDSIMSMYKRAESSRIDLEDLALDIEAIKSNLLIDESELNELNEIIAYLEMLKRKYGGSIESVISYRDQLIKSERASGDNKEEINELTIQYKNLKSKLIEHSEYISNERKKTSKSLVNAIKNNLKHLNMAETQFTINITTNSSEICETGIDSCEFYISTNSTEKPKPVSKIASGGEISRIMLAIKIALQSKDIVKTLIFDEIDSGISGAIAEKVGLAIEDLSQSHQILCITHLSQIAGKGNCHYRVSKIDKNNHITVKIDKLSKTERIFEIATLISGQSVTESSKKQAKELLQING